MRGLAGIFVALALLASGCGREDRLWRISPFDQDEDSSERVNLWPLAYHNGDATSILWPLFDVDDRGFALRPLIAKDESTWSLLFPFASFDTREREGWITPFYRVADNAGLFPLANFGSLGWVGPVWWDSAPEAKLRGGLFPLAWFGSTRVVGPLWWDSIGEGHGFFPLYGIDFLGNGIDHVGPVWWGRDAAQPTRWGFAPLLSYADAGRRFSAWPFYSQRLTDESRSRDVLLGLGHWHEDASSRERWLLPLYYDRAVGEAYDGVFVPFFWKRRRGEATEVYTLLGNRSVDAESASLNLYPLWWSNASAESTWRMLIPLFYFAREGDERTFLTPLGGRGWSESGERAFVNVFGPLFHHSVSTRRDEELTAFLWPLFESRREGETSETRMAGLYTRRVSPGTSESSYLLGLAHAKSTETGSSHRFWPLYSWTSDVQRPGIVYDLTLFGRAAHGDARKTWLFPLFSSERTTSLERWDALIGLVQHSREGAARKTLVWPFFSSSSADLAAAESIVPKSTLVGWSDWEGGRSFQLGAEMLYRRLENESPTARSVHASALVFLLTHDEEESLAPLIPAPEPRSDVNRVRHDTRGFLFGSFLSESATYRNWNDGAVSPDEASLLRSASSGGATASTQDAETGDTPHDRSAAQEILVLRGVPPADASPESLRLAIESFAADNTHTQEYRKLRIPLVFDYERDGDHARSSFLYYGYRGETRGERTHRDIFPFVTWDTGPDEKDVSFLWRFLHYERKGERRGGHLLFMRWGDV